MYWKETACVPSTLSLDVRVREMLRPGDRILDLGCGPGRVLAGLRADSLGCRHVGADINGPALSLARGQGLDVVRADLTALPFAGGAFDAGILHAVLTTIPGREGRLAVLAEARRVIGRVLCLADFLQNWELPYYRARYEAGLAETGETGSFLVREAGRVLYEAHHFTMDELAGLLGEAGFSVAHAATPMVRTRSGNLVRGVSLAAVAL